MQQIAELFRQLLYDQIWLTNSLVQHLLVVQSMQRQSILYMLKILSLGP